MTDLTSEKDRLKFFFPDGCGLLKTPARIENQYHEKGHSTRCHVGHRRPVLGNVRTACRQPWRVALSCRTDGRRWPDDAERDGLCHRLSGQQ